MMCLTGYGRFAELNGGYPDGYYKAAKQYGLLGDNGEIYTTITREAMARLVNSALDLPFMKQSNSDGSADSADSEEFVIMDGKSDGHPLETLSIKNFGGK